MTLDELLSSDVGDVFENEEAYFVLLSPEMHYDNSMWKIDKRTNSVSYMEFTQYILEEADESEVLSVEEFRSRFE